MGIFMSNSYGSLEYKILENNSEKEEGNSSRALTSR